jgi:hypothetical protein
VGDLPFHPIKENQIRGKTFLTHPMIYLKSLSSSSKKKFEAVPQFLNASKET